MSSENPGQEPRALEAAPGWLWALVVVLLLAIAALIAYIVRGVAIVEQEAGEKRSAEASQHLEHAGADVVDPETLLSAGYTCQQAGEYGEALDAYDRVLQIDPEDQAALYNKGVVLLAIGRGEDAEAVLRHLLEIAPDHALAAKALGQIYIAERRYEAALSVLEPALAAHPGLADLQRLAGTCCEQLGRTQDAIAYYEAALRYVPDDARSRKALERLEAAP